MKRVRRSDGLVFLKEFLVALAIVIPLLLMLAHGLTLQDQVEAQQLAHWQATVASGEEVH